MSSHLVVTVRAATADDLPALERDIPTKGGGTATRLARSLSGVSTLLVAVHEEWRVGRGEVLWDGCKADAVRAAHPGVPELNGLDVGEPWRGRGVGTAIVEHAAALVREAGRPAIGLGVDLANEAAYRLYVRLGFSGDLEYLDRYTIVHEEVRHDFADRCRFLVRPV